MKLAIQLFAILSTALFRTADANAHGSLYAAYVVLGNNGQGIARVITGAQDCPSIEFDGKPGKMHLRASPGSVPARTGSLKNAQFPVLVCEVKLPPHVEHISIAGKALPVPKKNPQRIVVIGDTGCRMNLSEHAFQSCTDPEKWAFRQISTAAAAFKPDLVIHVGDYLYRESPCPKGAKGCTGSPWGYGFDSWRADFFAPAKRLLAAAPWVMVRGNHESCFRAGQGWFRFLDAQPLVPSRSCDDPENDSQGDFSEPYSVPVSHDTQLIVFDSSKTANSAYSPEDSTYQRYLSEFRKVDELAGRVPHSFFLSHHPVLAFAPGEGEGSTIKPGNRGLQSVMQALHPVRLFSPGIDAAFHGHVHLFEALDFADDHPATVVAGNSGTATDSPLPKALPEGAHPAPGAMVRRIISGSGVGFLTIERIGKQWLLTERNRYGKPQVRCTLRGQSLLCARL